MMFNGFPSVAAYESECRRLGYATRRIPYERDGEKCFLLITSPPNKTATSVEAWTLFDASETKELLSGIVSNNADPGTDVNCAGKLAAHGYFPNGQRPRLQVLPTQQPGAQLSLF